MLRKIIKIDEEKCEGCGRCTEACHKAAIVIVDGKARLVRDDYCDALGNCLPVCPNGAISFEERETDAYNKAAVKEYLSEIEAAAPKNTLSELQQWPIQIKLVPANAPFFEGAHLLITADCAAYACGSFHSKFMKNKITIIGCPKLDDIHFGEKLREIIANNNISAVTVVQMEVPCCGKIELSAVDAIKKSGKSMPWQVVTLSTGGDIIE